MNKCILIGRLTAEPELRYTPNGNAVCTVCVAVDRDYKREGEERQADFIYVDVWGKTAENLAKYMGKGDRIAVDGRLQVDQYEKDGQKRTATKVVANRVEFLGSRSQGQKQARPEFGQDVTAQFSDEDLPFSLSKPVPGYDQGGIF